MHYDHRGNENNFNKRAGDVFASATTWAAMEPAALIVAKRLPRPNLKNVEIGRNRIWITADNINIHYDEKIQNPETHIR